MTKSSRPSKDCPGRVRTPVGSSSPSVGSRNPAPSSCESPQGCGTRLHPVPTSAMTTFPAPEDSGPAGFTVMLNQPLPTRRCILAPSSHQPLLSGPHNSPTLGSGLQRKSSLAPPLPSTAWQKCWSYKASRFLPPTVQGKAFFPAHCELVKKPWEVGRVISHTSIASHGPALCGWQCDVGGKARSQATSTHCVAWVL